MRADWSNFLPTRNSPSPTTAPPYPSPTPHQFRKLFFKLSQSITKSAHLSCPSIFIKHLHAHFPFHVRFPRNEVIYPDRFPGSKLFECAPLHPFVLSSLATDPTKTFPILLFTVHKLRFSGQTHRFPDPEMASAVVGLLCGNLVERDLSRYTRSQVESVLRTYTQLRAAVNRQNIPVPFHIIRECKASSTCPERARNLRGNKYFQRMPGT